MEKLFFTFQLSLILISINTFSQTSESQLKAKFLVEVGAEYGGDEILKVFFTNGNDQTMRAGQGAYLAFGGQLEFSKIKNLMLRASIGIKYNTTAADNANIRLTRIPINLIPYLKIKDYFRVGVGITSHQNVKFKGDGFVPDVDFTSSLGARFEFGYKWVVITYTSINYKAGNSAKVSANSLGLSLSFTFPNN